MCGYTSKEACETMYSSTKYTNEPIKKTFKTGMWKK